MPINSRSKGCVGERELSRELNRVLGCTARRGQQYNGLDGADVVGWDGVHVESKRVEKLKLYPALDQSVRDAKDGEVPVVCHRRNHREWVVIVRLDDLPALASLIKERESGVQGPDR